MRLADFADNSESARAAARLSQELFRYRVGSIEERNDQIRGLSVEDSSELVPREARRPLTGLDAIFGAGVAWRPDGTIAPVLLVDQHSMGEHAEPGKLLRLSHESEFGAVVSGLMPDPPAMLVFPIPEPVPYFGPGEKAHGPSRAGTFGAVFTEKASPGRALITTAGHVAPFGTTVTDAANGTGTVVWCHDPAATAGTAAAADIALVDPGRHGISAGNVTISGKTQSQPGSWLDVYGAMTSHGRSQTMGFVPALFVPAMAGMWGQLYFTTAGCSVPGDSGAPVIRGGTNEIVGHVVGGATGITSYIQSIDIQLNASGCRI